MKERLNTQVIGYSLNKGPNSIKRYALLFFMTAILLMLLSIRFYGYLWASLSLFPMVAGFIGIKKRNIVALLAAIPVVPASIATGVNWLNYYITVTRSSFYETVAAAALEWDMTFTAARWMIVAPTLLSILLIVGSLMLAFTGLKSRRLFIRI